MLARIRVAGPVARVTALAVALAGSAVLAGCSDDDYGKSSTTITQDASAVVDLAPPDGDYGDLTVLPDLAVLPPDLIVPDLTEPPDSDYGDLVVPPDLTPK